MISSVPGGSEGERTGCCGCSSGLGLSVQELNRELRTSFFVTFYFIIVPASLYFSSFPITCDTISFD